MKHFYIFILHKLHTMRTNQLSELEELKELTNLSEFNSNLMEENNNIEKIVPNKKKNILSIGIQNNPYFEEKTLI